MELLNRIAIVVQPKEPYLAWARSLEKDSPIDSVTPGELSSLYLAEEPENDDEFDSIIEKHSKKIFAEKLEMWWRNKKVWPKKRTYAMFLQWFNVRVVDAVYDLKQSLVERRRIG